MLNRWDHVSKIRDHDSVSNLKKRCSSTHTDAYNNNWRFWTVIGEPSAMNAERGG
jgi:hypothetical protein